MLTSVLSLLGLSARRLTTLVCRKLGAALSQKRTALRQARPKVGIHALQIGPVNLFAVGRH